jgi:hypothetical protein
MDNFANAALVLARHVPCTQACLSIYIYHRYQGNSVSKGEFGKVFGTKTLSSVRRFDEGLWGLTQPGLSIHPVSAIISLKCGAKFAIRKKSLAQKIAACAGALLFNPGIVGKNNAEFISIKNYTDIKDRYIPSPCFCDCVKVLFGLF